MRASTRRIFLHGIRPTPVSSHTGCKIGKAIPTLFCVPATKTVVEVRDRATGQPITPLPIAGPDPGDRLCYKIKCDAPSPPDTQVTDQFGTRTMSGLRAKLLCTPAVKGGPPTTTTTTASTTTTTLRFVDNGDGTVTDNTTGLQWEQKTGTVGTEVNCDMTPCSDPHDVNNRYKWSSSSPAADGSVFTNFLSRLNACTSPDGTTVTAVFAGHCDWRLPTIAELQTLVDTSVSGCGNVPFDTPCINSTFAPTASSLYWSSTTEVPDDSRAWCVFFNVGAVDINPKFTTAFVRAVRGGS